MKLSSAQQGVLAALAFIAFLELGLSGRFPVLWGLAFDPKQATKVGNSSSSSSSNGGHWPTLPNPVNPIIPIPL